MSQAVKFKGTEVELESGEILVVPERIVDTFLGIDEEGNFIYTEKEAPFAGELAGLTGCCGATATGSDGGVACRVCYEEVNPSLGASMYPEDIYIKVKVK
jgi:hypothetical protein